MLKNYFGNRLCRRNLLNGILRDQQLVGGSNNVQSHDQVESKLNSTIIVNIGIHTFVDEKVLNSPFSKNTA